MKGAKPFCAFSGQTVVKAVAIPVSACEVEVRPYETRLHIAGPVGGVAGSAAA